MRISDWSSDVCSSDLAAARGKIGDGAGHRRGAEDHHLGPRQHGLDEDVERAARGTGAAMELDAALRLAGRHAACIQRLLRLYRDEVRLAILQCLQRRALHRPTRAAAADPAVDLAVRSEEHTSELQSLIRISYAVFCLEKKID